MKRRPLYTGPRCEHPVNGGFCERPATQARPGSGRTGNALWFCTDHAEQYDAEQKGGALMDRDDARSALRALCLAADDVHAIVRDQQRPLRRRELGPVLARENYRDARARITGAIAALLKIVSSGGEHGDPSGNGGAGPTH